MNRHEFNCPCIGESIATPKDFTRVHKVHPFSVETLVCVKRKDNLLWTLEKAYDTSEVGHAHNV